MLKNIINLNIYNININKYSMELTISSSEDLNVLTNLIKKYAEKHKNDNNKLLILQRILQEGRQKLLNEMKAEADAKEYMNELYEKVLKDKGN